MYTLIACSTDCVLKLRLKQAFTYNANNQQKLPVNVYDISIRVSFGFISVHIFLLYVIPTKSKSKIVLYEQGLIQIFALGQLVCVYHAVNFILL